MKNLLCKFAHSTGNPWNFSTPTISKTASAVWIRMNQDIASKCSATEAETRSQ